MAAGDSSRLRRMSKLPFERRRIREGAKAVAHGGLGKVDVHVPFERRLFEPVQHVHGRLVERQRHLEREVSVDFENRAHEAH